MKTIKRRHTPKTWPTPDSPEVTGQLLLPCCGNTEQFIGHDDHGYPGDACECGKVVCECQASLRQPFRVLRGEVVYEAFTGGGCNSEIGAYDRIQCGRCEAQIWPPKPKALQHPDLDVTANPPGSSTMEFRDADNRPARQFRIKTRRRSSEPQSGGKTV